MFAEMIGETEKKRHSQIVSNEATTKKIKNEQIIKQINILALYTLVLQRFQVVYIYLIRRFVV